LLLTHGAVARLRLIPGFQKFIDPPLQVLIRDGRIERRNLRRCGLSTTDLQAVLRQHGYRGIADVHLAIFESKGSISIVPSSPRPDADSTAVRGSSH
jgi:uncharacterized membrane protein YcaP (DUF421 family)